MAERLERGSIMSVLKCSNLLATYVIFAKHKKQSNGL